jgi:hypothetical protein
MRIVLLILIVLALDCTRGDDRQIGTEATVQPNVLTESDSVTPVQPLRIPDKAPASMSVLTSGYTLTDTTDWGNAIGEEGQRAVLRRGREIIDTVDLVFGVLVAGKDSLVFLPIRTDSVGFSDGSNVYHESSRTEHVLWTPLWRRKLSDVLPLFNADFSSPTIADRFAIHYWGLSPDSGQVRLSAMRYDFRTTRLDSLFLRRVPGVATDYRWVYGVPQIKGTEVSFDSVVLDRKTWRVIRRDARPH